MISANELDTNLSYNAIVKMTHTELRFILEKSKRSNESLAIEELNHLSPNFTPKWDQQDDPEWDEWDFPAPPAPPCDDDMGMDEIDLDEKELPDKPAEHIHLEENKPKPDQSWYDYLMGTNNGN
jgi:hypothetical protein